MRAMIDFEIAQGAGQSPDRLVNATGLSDKSLRSYPIGMILPVQGIGRLILFDAHPSRDVLHQEIWGREVFLFDDGNRLVWQIAPEPGTTDDMHRNFDTARPATESFSGISNINGRFYASQPDRANVDRRAGFPYPIRFQERRPSVMSAIAIGVPRKRPVRYPLLSRHSRADSGFQIGNSQG